MPRVDRQYWYHRDVIKAIEIRHAFKCERPETDGHRLQVCTNNEGVLNGFRCTN